MSDETTRSIDSTKIVLVPSDIPSRRSKRSASGAIASEDAAISRPRSRGTGSEVRELDEAEKLAGSLSKKIGTLSKDEVEAHHDLDPATVIALIS